MGREFADAEGNTKVFRGKAYGFRDPYWRLRYSEGDWEELNRSAQGRGRSRARPISSPTGRLVQHLSAAVGLPAGDGQARGGVAAAVWRTNFAAVDLPAGDRQARGGVAAAEEERSRPPSSLQDRSRRRPGTDINRYRRGRRFSRCFIDVDPKTGFFPSQVI